jgi:transposase
MRYTVKQFNEEYPDDLACLKSVFNNRYGELEACPSCGVSNPKFYNVKGRKSFACKDCGYQLNPLANTIFHKSSTPLKSWFYAIYLFSISKNGVSTKELERHVGCSYKTAHRMEKQIRLLMAGDNTKLSGTVEADETFYGGRKRMEHREDNKTPILGVVEKNGQIRTQITDTASASNAIRFLESTVEAGATIHTDESKIYTHVKRNWMHESVRHVSKQWSVNGVHTNNIEGFWSQLKRSLDGTYHAVSPAYLNSYVNEFAFRYNYRNVLIFPILVERAGKPF